MKHITLISLLSFLGILLHAQTNNIPDITLVRFASGFSQPVGIENAGDSRLFVVEQTGKIKVVDALGVSKTFLDLSGQVLTTGFEQGLLGLAFHPEYSDNRYFYVHYTNLSGDSRISRFRTNANNPNKALPGSEVIMLEVDDPFANHNGGQMKFGPDGYLYFTIGDGGSANDPFNNAQDTSTLLGKLLRIDPTDDGGYDIPPTNPYVGVTGAMEEIYSTGLRNPWRFSFDALTGDLWIADVGQNAWEEINYTPASDTDGENYGWSCMEATHFFKADCDANGTPFTAPVAEYPHSTNPNYNCSGSVTGGYVYRGGDYPDMYGKYFYTDFCTGIMYTTWWNGTEWQTENLGQFRAFAYSSFGEDASNNLYLANKTSGMIHWVTDGGLGSDAYQEFPEEVYELDIPFVVDRRNVEEDDVDLDEYIREAIHRNPSSIIISSAYGDEYTLYPNPNHGLFTLSVDAIQDGKYTATITDIMGHTVLTEEKEMLKGENEWTFDSNKLSTGIYLMQLNSRSGNSTIKFVVE